MDYQIFRNETYRNCEEKLLWKLNILSSDWAYIVVDLTANGGIVNYIDDTFGQFYYRNKWDFSGIWDNILRIETQEALSQTLLFIYNSTTAVSYAADIEKDFEQIYPGLKNKVSQITGLKTTEIHVEDFISENTDEFKQCSFGFLNIDNGKKQAIFEGIYEGEFDPYPYAKSLLR